MSAQGIPAQPAQPQGQAKIKFGVFSEKVEAGSTVAAAREKMRNISRSDVNQVDVFVNGQKVTDDYVIQPNDTLQFSKRSGEKG